MKPTLHQRKILKLLEPIGSNGGYPARRLGKLIWDGWSAGTASGFANHECRQMERAGWLKRLDDQKPIVWQITESGRAAIGIDKEG